MHVGLSFFFSLPPLAPRKNQGATEKNKTRKRRTSAPARKKKYVRTFFFWAFLGKGSSKTREKKLSTFQKQITGEIFFRGGGIFSG
jgi:hypothetical protein